MYDVSDRASFDAIDSWLTEMKSDIGNPKEMENIVFVVCANKVRLSMLNLILICLKSMMFVCYAFFFIYEK